MKRKILNLVSFNMVFSLVSCAMCFLSFNTVYDYNDYINNLAKGGMINE